MRVIRPAAGFRALVALLAVVAPATAAHALCTAAQLIAADPGCGASGACNISRRHEVDNGCVLDFTGRDVMVTNNGTLVIGNRSVTIRARNFSVARSGLVDGRPSGGMVSVEATGDIAVEQSGTAGGFQVMGDQQGGTVSLDAGGKIQILGRVRASNTANRLMASGGQVRLRARGDVLIGPGSDVDVTGGLQACGGVLDVDAGGSIVVQSTLRAAGFDGGVIAFEAGRDLMVDGQVLNSASNGGSGGCIDIRAARNVQVNQALQSRGSGAGLGSGCGGEIFVASLGGPVVVRNSVDVCGGDPEGAGGSIVVSGREVQILSGGLAAEGAVSFSCGGVICVDADRDLTVGAPVVASGADFGGEIEVAAGGNLQVGATIDARSRRGGTVAGSIMLDAGQAGSGNLAVSARVEASGPSCSPEGFCSLGGIIDAVGCDVAVNAVPGAATAPTLNVQAPGATGLGGQVSVIARRRLTVTGIIDASGLGEPGRIVLAHPSSQPALISGQVRPSQAVNRFTCTEALCVETECRAVCDGLCDCGNGRIEQFEECDTAPAPCDVGEVCGVKGSGLACMCIDTCGNGRIDPGEDCEQGLLADCRTRGFATGTGQCVNCGFDETTCNAGVCGDGIIAERANEQCEATDLGGASCRLFGFARGDLRCLPDCTGFDTSGCVPGVCGDGILDPGEQCDAGAANANTPNAPCRPTCVPPRCGDGILDDLRGEECDDGNAIRTDRCVDGCRLATCGDGFVCSVPGCTTGPSGGVEQCDGGVCCLSTCGTRSCPDGRVCNDGGTNGCCHPDATCDDGDPCTADQCNTFLGCTHPTIAGCCRSEGECDDLNVCTADTCDVDAHRCVFTPIAGTCDDGSVCTQNDACSEGSCTGTAIDCTSPSVCLVAAGCDPVAGCRFDRVAGCCEANTECNDGNACTEESCDLSRNRCVSTPVDCASPDPRCLLPAGCDTVLGCRFERRGGPEALDCLLQIEVAGLVGDLDDPGLAAKLAKQLRKLVAKGSKKIQKGRDKAAKPSKAVAQLRKADKLFAKFLASVDKQIGKGLPPALGNVLLGAAETIRFRLGVSLGELGSG
jgi:hypothetical protein